MADAPLSRWERGGEKNLGYGRRFAELVSSGADVDGEARLADTLVARRARILDAGSGMGRVAAYLHDRGHRVVAAEPDLSLVEQSRRTYPQVEVLPQDILGLTDEVLSAAGGPAEFDLVVCVGNVIAFVAEGTEVAVLIRLRQLLAPGGRILVGFHLQGGPETARRMTLDQFASEVGEAGLVVEHRFGGYDLRPVDDQYAVWLLCADPDPAR
ncbi:class I SAM-dependent methyltransferase [Nocardioides bizhenqiangii]|uniref:Class I SAM-dependent methyltransferase n=1 Tax=Nocardioides bizhenqiangii TaxID=3095076 RepID=A0ABZ0ZP36_9ACTN|nr:MULTISPECIES: class I SAM-dependent methyltransferase [unclassified Nocardioides]MDZ5621328.1 class I SAM-dependent methyltransferase [Nocardioides sp. HM23]WQQ25830.1 class I SAM-dependent methyltransferase [Nocardioides sp. HM61]